MNEYDSKIRPQAIESGSFSIPTEHQGNNNPVQNVDPDPLDEEQAALIEEELNTVDEEGKIVNKVIFVVKLRTLKP